MHSRSARVQGLVFGGLMAALVVATSQIPLLSIIAPVAIVLVFVRHGAKAGLLSSLIALLFITAFFGIQAGILAFLIRMIPGVVFGYGFMKRWEPLALGVLTVGLLVLSSGILYAVTRVALFDGRDPLEVMMESETVRQQIEQAVQQAEAQLEQLTVRGGDSPQNQKVIEQNRALLEALRNDPASVFWRGATVLVVGMGISLSFFTLLLSRWILPRLGYHIPGLAPFAEFRLPNWVIWLYGLFGLGAVAAPAGLSSQWWMQILLAMIQGLSLIIILAGVAVAYGFLRRRNINKANAVLLIVAGFMLGQLGTMLYMLLAMWDSIFDFRGLGNSPWKRPEEST